MNISEEIKNQRVKNKWTQEQLADILNVSRSTVSSWEVGRNYPDLETIVAISDLFEISLDELLRGDKKMLEQIKHYLDWPLQLYALQEAEFSLQDELRGKFDNLILTIPKGIISSLADEL